MERMDYKLLRTLGELTLAEQNVLAAKLWAVYQVAQGSAVVPEDFYNEEAVSNRQREGWRDVLSYAVGMVRTGEVKLPKE